jgi:hypothetical protein
VTTTTIDGNTVETESKTIQATRAGLQSDIDYWNAQISNAQAHIAADQTAITQIDAQ